MKIQSGKAIQTDIPYTGPVLVRTKLGEMPQDYYSSSGYIDHRDVSCGNGACSRGGQEVWRGQPTYNADGSAITAPMVKHIDEHSQSPLVHGLVGGAIGGGVAGFFGFMGGLLAGAPLAGAGLGAAVGATLTGSVSALLASRDRIRLEWQEHPIQDLTMTGYEHYTRERTKEECTGFGKDRHCHTVNDGYDHRFSPKLDARSVGTFWEPEVVHFSAWDKEQKPRPMGTSSTGPR